MIGSTGHERRAPAQLRLETNVTVQLYLLFPVELIEHLQVEVVGDAVLADLYATDISLRHS
jgi:hypothetical protein